MAEGNCTHYWIIDSNNVGHCRYCPEVRDFSKLQKHESKLLGLTAKSGGTKGKRGKELANSVRILATPKSVAAKERWQDPAYRAKQSAAMKGRRHKKEVLL